MSKPLSHPDIARSTQTAWKAVFGQNLPPASAAAPAAVPRVTARVRITGTIPRSVVLDCPWEEARRMTASFYKQTPETTTPEQVKDMFGELVNMIGGQLKRFYPSSARLSLPEVGQSVQPIPPPPDGQRADFESGHTALTVCLYEETSR